MPTQTSYPGVYIEEIPSGVRTIAGVATSIAAFVGWAPQGPVDRAQRLLSWGDYERYYGGLHADSLLSFAVYHFFANGGSDAYVIRLAADDAIASSASTADTKLAYTAKDSGSWGDSYDVTTLIRSDDPTRFKLTVESNGSAVETFENLSMDPSDTRYALDVIREGSLLIEADLDSGADGTPPANDTTSLAGGSNGTVLGPDHAAFLTKLTETDKGINYLDRIDLFNLLCVPGLTTAATVGTLEKFCKDRRAFLIVDCAKSDTLTSLGSGVAPALTGSDATNAAFYFPWVKAPNPLKEFRSDAFPPSGFIAGLYARIDASRGFWKAAAGTEASLTGATGPSVTLTDSENGVLNPLGINCIRSLAVYGTVSWGARTLHGQDDRGSEWKYVPVRRVALFIEESLYRGLQWVVFEGNDEKLWSQIRLNAGAFMNNLFRQGAFQGTSPKDAYFVKCDRESTTQNDIDRGIVNIVIGFAPLKPAEFVIIKLQQIAGQIEV